MAISNSDKDAVYSATFDAFVRERNIDMDDTYWSDADWAAWEDRLASLRSIGALE